MEKSKKICPDCRNENSFAATQCEFCDYFFGETEIKRQEASIYRQKSEVAAAASPNADTNSDPINEVMLMRNILAIVGSTALLISFFLPFYEVLIFNYNGLTLIKHFELIKNFDAKTIAFVSGPIIFGITGVYGFFSLWSGGFSKPVLASIYVVAAFVFLWHESETWNAIFKIAGSGFYVGIVGIVLSFLAYED